MEKLKQNWKLYLGIGIFIFLVYFFFPSQFDYYLERDVIEFTLKETLVIVGIIFLIAFIIFYRFLSNEKDKIIRISQTFAFSVFIGFFYVFVFQGIIIGLGLFANRISDKEQITELFEVTYVMKNGEVGIRAIEHKYFDRTENKFSQTELEKIKEGDTINIIFRKGIFGKKYLKSGKITIAE